MWRVPRARIALALVLAGCVADAPPECGGAPEACALGETPACFAYPEGPYGIDEGEVLADFELLDCDGASTSMGQLLSQSELVLFNVGAGWCLPCIEETRHLEADLNHRFCGRGLRIVQVLFQDDELEPVTSLYCRDWRERFGLTFPVLRDPLFTTMSLFEDHTAQTPLNLLVTPDGTIVHREVGTDGAGLAERIDALLPP